MPEAARIKLSGGRLSLPPATLIRWLALRAGLAQPLWEPLTRDPQPGEAPADILTRYRAAVNARWASL